ncbi:MAG TPA: hypothetical protein VK582_01000 [Pyrinomonadaceae bacterium]|nr:hypothetical protein [Pyrinomonadaceae bacterium]
MTLEQWISVVGIVTSFLVWFLGQKWTSRKSVRKMWTDLTVIAIPVGLLLLSLVVFENDRTNSIRKETIALKEEVTRLENSFRDSAHVESIHSYEEFVSWLEHDISTTHSRWLITRTQAIQAPTDKEKRYFETMVARVGRGEIPDCRRLVRIPTKEHLDLYRNLLKSMRHSPNFGLGVWTANEPPFDYELLIGDEVVIFAFGSGAPTFGLRIPDKAVADRFAQTFDNLWRRSGSTRIIKERRDVADDSEFEAMIKQMESLAPGLPSMNASAVPYGNFGTFSRAGLPARMSRRPKAPRRPPSSSDPSQAGHLTAPPL